MTACPPLSTIHPRNPTEEPDLPRRLLARWSPLALACALVAVLTGANRPGAPGPLYAAGLLGNDSTLLAIPPDEAGAAAWLPGSTVLVLDDGRLRWLPPGAVEAVTVPSGDPGALAAAAAERAWLASGTVPGADEREREAAERSLLLLRLLLRPGGAAIAAPHPYWAYVWPRDASFAAAAFALTGHRAEAAAILGFLAGTQAADGTWPARSHPDGRPVADGRRPQLDATGWVPWAAWLASGGGRDQALAAGLWPMVERATRAAVRSLRPDGLPPAGPDYAERRERAPTLGTAAPVRLGLRAAAGVAAALGRHAEAARLRAAADRLDAAIRSRLRGPAGYHRTPAGGGADQALTWLVPPFAPAEPAALASVAAARITLAAGGGMIPSAAWSGADPWTPATASFALAAAASGDQAGYRQTLGWLLEHRTGLGAFPERVRRADGAPRSVAPLGWTHALVLLALTAAERPLPVP